MRGKTKGWGKGKESTIAVTEGRAEVRKQTEMRVSLPDSCGANPVDSEQRREKKRVQKPSITDTSVLLASETCRNIALPILLVWPVQKEDLKRTDLSYHLVNTGTTS